MKTQLKPAGSSGRQLADHRTPFVFNEWYVAATSEEVGRSLLSRQILGKEILLYRKLDGQIAALRNRCPHRSFPLSKGTLDGDHVVCGYHGLAFAKDGECVRIPSQAIVPSAVRAQSFLVVERDPLVWIWMGEPEKADVQTIPQHPWLDQEGFTHVGGYLNVKSNYIRLHENVLDLTHFPFLHGAAVGDEAYAKAPFEVTEDGNSVCITRELEDYPVNAAYGTAIGNMGHRVNRTSESRFETPGFHIAHAKIEDLEGGVGGRTDFHFKFLHMFTPESQNSTHYFWASARDVALKNEELSVVAKKNATSTFLEDVDALEWIENAWQTEDEDFQEISISGDRAGLLMRRIIARRVNSEG